MNPFDSSGAFRNVAQNGELKRLAVRSGGVTIFFQGFGFAIQMVSTMVLARLLTPADFGVVTMVTTFSLLLSSFGLNGFTEAILQQSHLNQRLASNLFWINLAVGLCLTLGFAGCGGILARFFHDRHVARVAVGLALTIFISSASVLHLALLKRAMRFTAVSLNDILARALAVVLSIFLAWLGWGYWALVAGAIVLPFSQAIGAWFLCRWVPDLPKRGSGTIPLLKFATSVYLHFIVNYSARNLDNVLVGWRFQAQALGFYKKAYDLFVLPANNLLSPLGAVIVTTLSRLDQDRVQYRRYFLSGLSILAFAGMGIGADLTLIAKDLIRLFLGPGWETAGRIFAFFGPGIGVMLLYNTHGWIHLSIGKADRWFRWGVVEFLLTTLLFILGLRWGPEGVAVAWTASFWLLLLPAFWYAGRPIQLHLSSMVAVIWKYFIASLLAACATALIFGSMPNLLAAPGWEGALMRTLVATLLFVILYLGAVILLHRGVGPLQQVVQLLSGSFGWNGMSRPSPATRN